MNTAWTVAQPSPIIAPGMLHSPYDDGRASAAHVLRLGDRYRMVYWGSDREGRNTILQAESPVAEPNRWQALGGPLLEPQPEGDLNCVGPSFPFLLPVTQDYWLLYVTRWGRARDGKLPNTTTVALSEDGGRTWRYHDGPAMLPLDRPYDREGTGSLWVVIEEGSFRMYYTAIGKYIERPDGVATGHGDVIPRIGIGYAESRDGITWEKPLDTLLVEPRGFTVTPYEYICSKPCVVKGKAGYTMWVNTFGTAYRVHRLISRNGLTWTWVARIGPDGELGTGEPGAFDDVQRCYPCVVVDEDTVHCWYTGNGFGATGMGYAWASAQTQELLTPPQDVT